MTSRSSAHDRARDQAVFDRAVHAMSQGLIVLDPRGRVVSANPQASRLLGWTTAQLVGSDVHDTVHQHSQRSLPPAEPCALLDVARTGEGARDDADLFLRVDGSLLPVSWVADPLLAENGDHSDDQGEHAAGDDGAQATGVVVRFIDATSAQMSAVSEAASREQDRAALWDAQQSVSDLGWIAELTRVMSSTRDEAESLRRLARLMTPRLADICIVDIVDDSGGLRRIGGSAAAHVEVDLDAVLSDPLVQHHVEDAVTRSTVAAEAVTRLDATQIADPTVLSAPSRRLLQQLGVRSLLITPLAARSRMVGLAGLIRLTDHGYTDTDMLLAADIGRRAGLVLDNLRLFQVEQRVAEQLQLALLPAVRPRDHLDIAARYLPAANRNRVGGDWYDVFPCPTINGNTSHGNASGDVYILVIGDVAGHDLQAATTMAALRNLVRGVAVTDTGGPAHILATIDHALPTLDIAGTATAAVVRIERSGQGWTVTWANAGHTPILSIDPFAHTVELLDGHPDPLLGTRTDPARHDHQVQLETGSKLVLYTDGLVERRNEDIDLGLLRLQHSATRHSDTATELLGHILTAMPISTDDDTAVMVVHLL